MLYWHTGIPRMWGRLMRRKKLPTRLLRRARDRHSIAQAFQGFESPLPRACLLSWVPLIVPRLLITGPQSEERGDDHE